MTSGLLDGQFVVAFEDKPLRSGSDRDFNDAIFAIGLLDDGDGLLTAPGASISTAPLPIWRPCSPRADAIRPRRRATSEALPARRRMSAWRVGGHHHGTWLCFRAVLKGSAPADSPCR